MTGERLPGLRPELEDDVDRRLGDLPELAEAGVLGQLPYCCGTGLSAERGRFRAWLGTVTRNKLRRFRERDRQQVRADGGGAQDECLAGAVAPPADTEWAAFFNARIVGSSIYARAWELLIAMLVLEVAFGVGGLVIAPIYYAYVKGELTDRNLV